MFCWDGDKSNEGCAYVAYLDKNCRAFGSREGGMPTPAWIAYPSACGVFPLFIAKQAIEYIDFFAAGVGVRVECGVRRPPNQGGADAAVFMQRQNL